MIEIKYDSQADAMNIRLADRPVARTKIVSEAVNVDFDADGEVVNVEILDVRRTGIDPFAVKLIDAVAKAATIATFFTAPDGTKIPVRQMSEQEMVAAGLPPHDSDKKKPK